MGDPSMREDQILNLVRSFYETSQQFVLGGYQDTKDPTVYYFLLFSAKEAKESDVPSFVLPYFISIEAIESLDILEDVIEAYPDSVLLAILPVVDHGQKFYYLVFKDFEYFQLQGNSFHVEPPY